MSMKEKENNEANDRENQKENHERCSPTPAILEEITIEELAVDGICGIY